MKSKLFKFSPFTASFFLLLFVHSIFAMIILAGLIGWANHLMINLAFLHLDSFDLEAWGVGILSPSRHIFWKRLTGFFFAVHFEWLCCFSSYKNSWLPGLELTRDGLQILSL